MWFCQYKKGIFFKVNLNQETITGDVKVRYLPEPEFFLEVLFPLFEILRRRGLYAVHCGAVGFKEKKPKTGDRRQSIKGIIFPGKAGAGKSSLVLHLVAQGAKFLSDDRCLLSKDMLGFQVFGLREKVRICPENFAGITKLAVFASGNPGFKKSFNITDVYPDSIIEKAKVKLIVFPSWQPQEKSRLTPISASEALKEILPLSLEAFFPDSAKANFEFLSDLVTSLPCYRFYLGKDRENWYNIIKRLVC
ncbi:MAG: hypothetical protein ABIK39_03510 [candidate division WOR-3 bacterium]